MLNRFVTWSERQKLTRAQWGYLAAWTVPIILFWSGVGYALTRIFTR